MLRTGVFTMNCIPLLLLTFSLLLLTATPDYAQAETEPIYFVHENAIWRWTESEGLTQMGEPFPNLARAFMSPTNNMLAIVAYDERMQELYDAECPCGGPAPRGDEYWLLDLTTEERTLVAAQPENAENLGDAVHRGYLLWSPDGAMFAWAEGLEYSNILVYDLAGGTTTTIAEAVPSQSLVSSITELTRWTPTGIWVRRVNYDENLIGMPAGYAIYDLNGDFAAEIPPYLELAGLPNAESQIEQDYNSRNAFAVLDDGMDTLVTHSRDGWQVYNLETSEAQPLTVGTVVQASAAAPDASLRVYPSVLGSDGVYRRDVHSPDGTVLATLDMSLTILSPSGQAIVTQFQENEYSIVYADGSTYRIELPWTPDAVLWGRTSSRLERGGEHVLVGARCEGGTLPFRFPEHTAEQNALVGHLLGDATLPLYADTSEGGKVAGEITTEERGEITAGESFELFEGPRCENGTTWWRIEADNGNDGWIAEGQGDQYQIAPGCSNDYCEGEG